MTTAEHILYTCSSAQLALSNKVTSFVLMQCAKRTNNVNMVVILQCYMY